MHPKKTRTHCELFGKQVQSAIKKENLPLMLLSMRYYFKHRIRKIKKTLLGFVDMWSADFTCVTLVLSLAQMPDNVSLQVCCRRTEEMEVISLQPMFLQE